MGIAASGTLGVSQPTSVAALRALTEWATATELADIPAAVLQRAAAVIMDDLAAAIAVRNEPEVRRYREWAQQRADRAEATLFDGGRTRTDRFWAATVNAMAMATAEIDEGYQSAPCHAGLYTVPTLMAEAEAENVSVGALLRAQALSYELVTRIARGWRPPGGPYPALYTHARFAAIGAACASCLVRRVDAETLRQAIGIAATLITAGPRDHLIRGAAVRNVWPSAGTWNGMMSARWAEFGVTGLESTLDSVFVEVLGFQPQTMQLNEDLGRDWAVQHGYSRMYACHLAFIPLIECLLELRPHLVGQPMRNIDAVLVSVGNGVEYLATADPATTLAARFSIPHLVAATLVLGHALPAAFATDALTMPAIAALRSKVLVVASDSTQAAPGLDTTTVEIRAEGNRFIALRAPPDRKGGEYCLSRILDKINDLTQDAYPQFGDVARRLITGDGDLLAESSAELVTRLTLPARPETLAQD